MREGHATTENISPSSGGQQSLKASLAMSRRTRFVVSDLHRIRCKKFAFKFAVRMEFIRGSLLCDLPKHLEAPTDVIDEWLLECKCTTRQRKRILSCLDTNFLQRLPVVGKSRPWPANPSNRNFRYHFRAQASRVSQWRERMPFPAHIDTLIRQVWPENVISTDRKGARQGCCETPACRTEPKHATSGETKTASSGETTRRILAKVMPGDHDVGGGPTNTTTTKRCRWYTMSSSENLECSTAATIGEGRNHGE